MTKPRIFCTVLLAALFSLSACGKSATTSATAAQSAASSAAASAAASSAAAPASSAEIAAEIAAIPEDDTQGQKNDELAEILNMFFSDCFGGEGGLRPETAASWYSKMRLIRAYDTADDTHTAIVYVAATTTADEAAAICTALEEFSYRPLAHGSVRAAADGTVLSEF